MARSDTWRRINRLLDEIAVLQKRIVDGVRRNGMPLEQVKTLEQQVSTRKSQIEGLKTDYLVELSSRPRIVGATAPGETPMTVEEAMIVATTLKMQRPMVYSTEEWQSFRRVCAALAELFGVRLAGSVTPFDPEHFLISCGLTSDDARRLTLTTGPPSE